MREDERGVTRAGWQMWDMLYYLAIVLFLAVATIAGGFAVRTYLGGGPMGAVGGLFGPRPERRVYVVEQSNLDARRRLILIRRDDVEHLIMTGGPVDVVIETGIGVAHETSRQDTLSPRPAVSERAPMRP